MKNYLYIIVVVAMTIMTIGCEKNPQGGQNTDGPSSSAVTATLTVTDIADNCATIDVTSNSATRAMIVKAVRNEDVTIDLTKDIQLISWIEANGTEVTLPYKETLTGVSVGKDMLTAVAVYNASGRAEVCKYVVWTPAGAVDGWSSENNPGTLDEETWN